MKEIRCKVFIGMDKEKKEITVAVLQRKNLFLYGREGVGKTSIVKHVVKETVGKGVLYSEDSTTLRTSFLGFLKGDFDTSFLSSQNVSSLRKLFYRKLKEENPYLVFDHMGRVGPRFFSYLENLLDEHPMLIIARGRYSKEIGNLSLLLFSFDKLQIYNLNKKHTYDLINYFIESFKLVIDDIAHFKEEVFNMSCGNPSVIREICQYAMESKYKIGKKINFNLLNLDRKIDSLNL